MPSLAPWLARLSLSSSRPAASAGLVATARRAAAPSTSTASTSSGSSSPFSTSAASCKLYQPRRTKYRKAQKGREPLATGGSTAGTTLTVGEYGLRVLRPCRITAKQLDVVEMALKRSLKPFRGSSIYLRVFPDIPVCIKGNETRMGKGKGTFEYWACRARPGRVVFEIGGPNLRPEIAKSALAVAAAKLPTTCEFIDRTSGPVIGHVEDRSVVTSSARLRELTPKKTTAGAVAARALEAAEQVADAAQRARQAGNVPAASSTRRSLVHALDVADKAGKNASSTERSQNVPPVVQP